MTKDLMGRLSELDPARERTPSAAEWTRSNARIERIMMEQPRPTSDPRRITRRTTVLLGAAATAAAIGIIAGTTLIPSDDAFASWEPVPVEATADQALEQAETCSTSWSEPSARPLTADDIVLAERRGENAMTIFRQGSSFVECIDIGDGGPTQMVLDSPGEALGGTPPTGADVVIDTIGASGSGSTQYTDLVGFVGPDVTAVSIVIADGTEVVATVSEGWLVAWWPGADGMDSGDLTTRITTAVGTTEATISSLLHR